MKLIFVLFIGLMRPPLAWSHDEPIRSDSGTISYATEDLLRRRGELIPPPDIYQTESLNRVLFSELSIQNKDLKKVKYYLINGETRLARIFLHKLLYTQTKLRPVIYRYLAILSFIEGDFEKTYSHLSLPEFQNIPQYGKICLIKILTQIVLNKTTELEENWARCQLENSGNLRVGNLIWLDTLIQVKVAGTSAITKIPFKSLKIAAFENNELKVMLKLGLYLNQEKLLSDQISNLSIDQLKDPEIRELAGHILFKAGHLAKSYRFVEDLKSPNSENIKGNLYLLRKKLELANAQFKLALEQKQNSQNALERLIPLAWLLGDWETGSKYAEHIVETSQTKINKMALTAAFLMQRSEYEAANKTIEAIIHNSPKGTDLDVTQLGSFTALMLNRPDSARKQAALSCSQYDLINCWLQLQLTQWDSFPLSIRREDKIPDKKEWETLTKEDISQPIKEMVFINQIDIEEMDDKLIQLIPTP